MDGQRSVVPHHPIGHSEICQALTHFVIIQYIVKEKKLSKQAEHMCNRGVNVVLLSHQFFAYCDLDNKKVFFLTIFRGLTPVALPRGGSSPQAPKPPSHHLVGAYVV